MPAAEHHSVAQNNAYMYMKNEHLKAAFDPAKLATM